MNDLDRGVPAEEGDLVRELLGGRVWSSLMLFTLIVVFIFVLSRCSLWRFSPFRRSFCFIFRKPEVPMLAVERWKRLLFLRHSLPARSGAPRRQITAPGSSRTGRSSSLLSQGTLWSGQMPRASPWQDPAAANHAGRVLYRAGEIPAATRTDTEQAGQVCERGQGVGCSACSAQGQLGCSIRPCSKL